MRRIEIVPFGGLKPFFEAGCFLDVESAFTVDQIKNQLGKQKLAGTVSHTAALALLEASAISTETEILAAGVTIPADAKVLFLLPPVSGG
jgi:hypothetical protein